MSADVAVIPEIILPEHKLKELWSKGIINDLSYVAFALEFDKGKPVFDPAVFASQWSIAKEDLTEFDFEEGRKPKYLKPRTVLNAIGILEEKGFARPVFTVQLSQLSLFE